MSTGNGLRYVYAYNNDFGQGVGSNNVAKEDGKIPTVCQNISKSLNEKLNNGDKRSLKKDGYTINAMKTDKGVLLICVATDGVSKLRIIYGLLEELAEMDLDVTSKSKVAKVLTERMKVFNDPNSDVIAKCNTEIDKVKDLMVDNLEKVFGNLAKLEEINTQAEVLEQDALDFKKVSVSTKNSVVKNNLIISCIVVSIIMIACGFCIGVIVVVALIINDALNK